MGDIKSTYSLICVCVFGLTCLLQVSLKENGSLSKDSNVTMEIPIHTTLAYALIELEIKHDGRYGEKSFAKFIDKLDSFWFFFVFPDFISVYLKCNMLYFPQICV